MATRQRKTTPPSFNLDSHQWFLNRELTWLAFNKRVLHEATDDQLPLLERVFFIAVVGSNLDEFFMKRIGGLKQQVGAGVKKLTIDGMLPQEQIDACYKVAQEILEEQRKIADHLRELLEKEEICFRSYAQLTATQKKQMDQYFKREIYPLLTPQGIDPAHPFPFISNLSLNILVTASEPRSNHQFLNRIKVPLGVGVPRFIRIGSKHLYITFEELIANNLDDLFPGLTIHSYEYFRVTRNAITDRQEEQANDLLSMIESALRDRKFADIVRLQTAEN
ncbi:MAG: RNA degradosome polyphosphate kinase, partial [Desulfofustis sp.]|nr:RNA degradosome polyphosphate kinase [Desulfofustis sp.]